MESNNQTPAQLRKFQEETVNRVLNQVKEYQKEGGLVLPNDYSAANALKSAWFKLLETKDKNDKPVLETCTKTSIANALLKMVTEGLNVHKNQCSFIAYGNTLTMQREYFGTIALAKRYNPDILRVTANIIYQDDVFEFEIDSTTGMRRVLKHEQKLENIDINKIRGAYATICFDDGTSEMEPMTISQIIKAWEMGYAKGGSKAHKNFTDQMAKKTVVNRICKPYINSSNDAVLTSENKSQHINPGENEETIDVDAENADNENEPSGDDLKKMEPKEAMAETKEEKPEIPNELNFNK